jgi:hypothetical protein
VTQQELDERDRRWAYELLAAGFSADEAARLIDRPVEFIVGPPCRNCSKPSAIFAAIQFFGACMLDAFRAEYPSLSSQDEALSRPNGANARAP